MTGLMVTSKKTREELIADTKFAAKEVYEDLMLLEDIVKIVEPWTAKLRNTTVVLRRLLLEGRLSRIGKPRIGKISIETLDFQPLFDGVTPRSSALIVTTPVTAYNVHTHAIVFSHKNDPFFSIDFSRFNPLVKIPLTMDRFLSQEVFFLMGTTVTRKEVIEFAAYSMGGVHPIPRPPSGNSAIESIDAQISFRRDPEVPGQMLIRQHFPDRFNDPYDPTAFGPVFAEILFTSRCIVESASVIELKKHLISEFDIDSSN